MRRCFTLGPRPTPWPHPGAENQIYKGLDEDEHEFMEALYRQNREKEEAREREVSSHLEQFRQALVAPRDDSGAVAALPEPVVVTLGSAAVPGTLPKKSQAALLAGCIKRKGSDGPDAKKPRLEPAAAPTSPAASPAAKPAAGAAAAALVATYSDSSDAEDEDQKSAAAPASSNPLAGLVGYGGDDDSSDAGD